MAGSAHLTREDRLGLGIAVAAHVALAALFVFNDDTPANFDIPERMTVSLANEVSLESTAPDPSAEPAASIAPEIAEEPSPPVPEPVEQVIEREVEPAPPPPPRPRATQRPEPRPSPAPSPRATQRPEPRSSPSPAPRASASPRARPTPAPSPARQRAGGSRIGADFLEGRSDTDGNRGSPAAAFGATEAAALNSAISRQLKPHWSSPSGVDADQLVTIVRFRLNRDGSLAGSPSCISQSGVTASNEPQKELHCDRAIRAVRLASPFDLPDQFYDKWQLVDSRFDRRL
jgi:outer membrane biosynthesis protein TonB